MHKINYDTYIKKQPYYHFLNTLTKHYPTYIFGGALRSYFFNLRTNDIDIFVLAKEEDFTKNFPDFTPKLNLNNQQYFTNVVNGMKFDITLYNNLEEFLTRQEKNNYFFNKFIFFLNNPCFYNLDNEKMRRFQEKRRITLDLFNDIDDHFKTITKSPTTLLKALRFSSQANISFDKEYVEAFRKYSLSYKESCKEKLNPSITLSELNSILTSNHSHHFFNFNSFLSPDIANNDIQLINFDLKNTQIIYVLCFYALQTNKEFIFSILEFYNMPLSNKEDINEFLKFFDGNPISTKNPKTLLLYKNYCLLFKKQLALH